CLGGGTVVNWSTSFRVPDGVLDEWERDYGLSGFTNGEFARHYDAVSARVGVNSADSSPNASNAVIERGCTNLGYHWGVIPRNADHCEQRCGACGYGCAFSRKQSTLLTYLQDAADRGARFVVNTSVDRVLIENGQTVGVVATTVDPVTGARHHVTVHATTVVISAGALHTPAILLRSGIRNPHLGRNLHLHPVVAVTGFYPDPIHAWEGSLQTRYSDEFGHPADGYGYKFEVAPGHPGLMGLALPWESGQQHKTDMARLGYAAPLIVLVRDRNSGRVTLDKHGEPIVDYPLGEAERRMLTQGAIEGAKVHLAAGAMRVGTLHTRLTMFDAPSGTAPWQSQEFTNFARDITDRGLEPNRTMLFSAHQMGSARMAADPRRGVVGADNQVFGVKGLFVADGSAFPTASGVNPMLTILALAHRAAGAIQANM
nr:GMC family oxidoreductase [Ktedonobacterales bacterium]